MTSFFAIAMAATGLGHASAFAVDAGKAEAAKRSIFALIDRASAIDATAADGPAPPAPLAGRIELRNVRFTYPARPESEVLHGVSFVVEAGTTVAIVGPSGSGKSSIVQTLLRFYDPSDGAILLDGVDIRTMHPGKLRAAAGWVQQEAPLFADSVAYNIAYGKVDGKPAPDCGMPRDAEPDAPTPAGFTVPADVVAAAEAANAAGFVASFKHGYATFVGDRGNQLSGGQKQRVAIARAIIRTPKLLL